MQTLIYYTQDFSSQYIDNFDELPFDKNSLRYHVERIVEASAPWQSWAMNVRSIYRWENPKKTAKWLALYIYLWYTQHVVTYLVSFHHHFSLFFFFLFFSFTPPPTPPPPTFLFLVGAVLIDWWIWNKYLVDICHLQSAQEPILPRLERIPARIDTSSS